MKLKLLTGLISLTSVIPTCLVACNNTKVNKSEIAKIIEDKKDNNKDDLDYKWENFVNTTYIQMLLKYVYGIDNQDKITAYVKSQRKLNLNYVSKLKWSLYYANNIVSSWGYQGGEWSPKPELLRDGTENIEELFSKNWLWYLFNLDKFIFASYPDFDQFDSSIANTTNEIYANSLKLGTFYKPQSNKIIDFTVQKYDKTIDKVYLLTEAGFIISFTINHREGEEPFIQNYGYIHVFKNVAADKEVLQGFSLNKFIEMTEGFQAKPVDRTSEILFKEKYGGKPLRYTLIDIDENKFDKNYVYNEQKDTNKYLIKSNKTLSSITEFPEPPKREVNSWNGGGWNGGFVNFPIGY
ncbi:hypothetical protein FJO69_01420 [[Mycoplasma] falconis]|uniref:Uncharacterized protein n=1 Tax=[Mycoplasma] falconis TaxID=92403 RepID=A0A501XB98_9BACT|nr:aromatic motif membrane protein [[Mycoplasma] falconis]TPE57574.1 hypothetical protein FJO69_01420 [[Mycoplasma] falconis]